MKEIYRSYSDTEVSELSTRVECPYCGMEWLEADKNDCGETYVIKCDNEWEDGCGKEFKMHFDA